MIIFQKINESNEDFNYRLLNERLLEMREECAKLSHATLNYLNNTDIKKFNNEFKDTIYCLNYTFKQIKKLNIKQ